MSKPENNSKSEQPNNPLFSQINDLIDKEKTLLELKLLEQQVESDKWKTKYDSLKENVYDKAGLSLPIETLDHIAESEEISEPQTFKKIDNFQAIEVSSINGCIGNFNNLEISKTILFDLAKQIFGSSSLYTDVNIAWFRSCNLDESFIEPLCHIFRSPKLFAIDLSYNNINEKMFSAFVDILNNRKETPQYLLLHGNNELATTSKSYLRLFNSLSFHTWGLTISLQDFPNNAFEIAQSKLKKAEKLKKPDPFIFQRDLVQPAMRISHFFKSLQENLTSKKNPNIDMTKSSKDTKGSKTSKDKFLPRAIDVFEGLSVLGIREYHMTYKSIPVFESCYFTCLEQTLTDLDLTFCYLGYVGAQTIERILQSDQCSLIRLSLKGNAFTDQAGELISTGFQKNTSLIYLDLSSNLFSMQSLKNFANISVSKKCLTYLNLTNNNDEIPEELIDEFQNRLDNIGSLLEILWDNTTEPDQFNRFLLNIPDKLYWKPHTTRKVCSVGKAKLIETIHLTPIFKQQPQFLNSLLRIQWLARPSPITNIDTLYERMIYCPKVPKSPYVVFEEAYMTLNDKISLFWEIRLINKGEIVYRFKGEFPTDNPKEDMFQEYSAWTHMSHIIKNPPKYGKIELRFLIEPLIQDLKWLENTNYLAFETKSIVASHLPRQNCYLIGGDDDQIDPVEMQLHMLANFDMEVFEKLYPDENLMRVFFWPNKAEKLILKWESKITLIVSYEDGKEIETPVNSSGLPNQHQLISYDWALNYITHVGSSFPITRGKAKVENTEKEGELLLQEETKETDLLSAWKWQSFEVEIPLPHIGFHIVLNSQLTTKNPQETALLTRNCMVMTRNFYVYSSFENLDNVTNEALNEALPYHPNLVEIYCMSTDDRVCDNPKVEE